MWCEKKKRRRRDWKERGGEEETRRSNNVSRVVAGCAGMFDVPCFFVERVCLDLIKDIKKRKEKREALRIFFTTVQYLE